MHIGTVQSQGRDGTNERPAEPALPIFLGKAFGLYGGGLCQLNQFMLGYFGQGGGSETLLQEPQLLFGPFFQAKRMNFPIWFPVFEERKKRMNV